MDRGRARWFEWLSRAERRAPAAADDWRGRWAEAVDRAELDWPRERRARREEMEAAAGSPDGFELEREMMDGLDALAALRRQVLSGELPAVATGHRAVGTERCHFEPGERAVPDRRHAAPHRHACHPRGGRPRPRHPVARRAVLVREERDVLITVAGGAARRVRCNSYADALRAAFLAGHLTGAGRV